MTQPLRVANRNPDLPRTYVHCTVGKEGEFARPHVERIRADPSWGFVELAADHVAHVSAPEMLTATLLELVAQAGRG